MNDFNDFFNDDPWCGMLPDSYPDGRRLYQNDDRFWVSINEKQQLLFFIHENKVCNIKTLTNMAGVNITIEPYGNHTTRLVCVLSELNKEERRKFSIVAKNIAYSCSDFNGEQLFIKVQEQIKSWANFLKPTRSGLSQAEYVGLWGELYFVAKVLMKVHTPSDAVRFWVGPDSKKQDVVINAIAIEIKTSISGDARVIKISSLDQLDKITEYLYLLHIIASPATNDSGVSLADLYQNCLNNLNHDGTAEVLFLQKISELYGKANQEQLNNKLSIISLSMFDVSDDFPKIVRKMVPTSIASLKYEIYIESIREFEVSQNILEIVKNG